jgi:hypothetical protein
MADVSERPTKHGVSTKVSLENSEGADHMFRYPMADEILNVRLSLIASAKSLEGPQLGDMQSARTSGLLSIERDCLTAIGVLARNRGDLPGAISALTKVQSLTVADAADHRTEFAEVLWLQGQHSLALGQLKSLLRSRAYAKPLKPEEYWLRANVLSLLVSLVAFRMLDPCLTNFCLRRVNGLLKPSKLLKTKFEKTISSLHKLRSIKQRNT